MEIVQLNPEYISTDPRGVAKYTATSVICKQNDDYFVVGVLGFSVYPGESVADGATRTLEKAVKFKKRKNKTK